MIDWSLLSNLEIEVKIKELEFEYKKTQNEIVKLGDKLNELSLEYNKGNKILQKRLRPKKI